MKIPVSIEGKNQQTPRWNFHLLFSVAACFLFGVLPGKTFGQNVPDSIQASAESRPNSKSAKPAIRPASLLLPGVLFTYGVLSLNINGLKKINRSVHRHVANTQNTDPFQIESYLQWAPSVAIFGLKAAGVNGTHTLPDLSIIYGLTELIQASLTFEIKNISNEIRPNKQGNKSFPSGHTSNAFATAEILRREYQGINAWYGVGGYAFAIATASLRMVHNKHWLGDVIGGAGVGIFSADMAYLIHPLIKNIFRRKEPANTFIIPTWQPGGGQITLLHCL